MGTMGGSDGTNTQGEKVKDDVERQQHNNFFQREVREKRRREERRERWENWKNLVQHNF